MKIQIYIFSILFKKGLQAKSPEKYLKQLKERYEGLECNGKMYRYTDHIHVIALFKYKNIKVNRHTMFYLTVNQ